MEKNQNQEECNSQKQESTQQLMTLGERFKQAREEKGLTLTDVGNMESGVSASYLFRVEKLNRMPSLSVIQKLAEIYEVSPKNLIGAECLCSKTPY